MDNAKPNTTVLTTSTNTANDRQEFGDHYQTPIQHWDFVLANNIGYLEGCATKYLVRWRKKNGLQDLIKARHYVDKLIEVAQAEEAAFKKAKEEFDAASQAAYEVRQVEREALNNAVCECTHRHNEHEYFFGRECSVPNCTCREFKEYRGTFRIPQPSRVIDPNGDERIPEYANAGDRGELRRAKDDDMCMRETCDHLRIEHSVIPVGRGGIGCNKLDCSCEEFVEKKTEAERRAAQHEIVPESARKEFKEFIR